MGWLSRLFSKTQKKSYTREDFKQAFPDFTDMEVNYIGSEWQLKFQQGNQYEINSDFVKQYISRKQDYIKLRKSQGEPCFVNDILWAYYNEFKGAYSVQMMKRGGWTKRDLREFNSRCKDDAKWFKEDEKFERYVKKSNEFLAKIDEISKELKVLRSELKEINAALKTDKSDELLERKNALKTKVEKLMEENSKLQGQREKHRDKYNKSNR
jgi:DNA repair exonuclease SbcCD ATPase subunit